MQAAGSGQRYLIMNPGAWRYTGGDWSDGLGAGNQRSREHWVYSEPGAFRAGQVFAALCAAVVTVLAYIL